MTDCQQKHEQARGNRPKHRREAAQNVIILEVSIRGDTDCTQGVSTWLANKKAGDRFLI